MQSNLTLTAAQSHSAYEAMRLLNGADARLDARPIKSSKGKGLRITQKTNGAILISLDGKAVERYDSRISFALAYGILP